MRSLSKKPILITGSHRSGSTWVGKMIASSPKVHYIHEPFNVDFSPGAGISRSRFKYWYTYISEENEDQYYSALKDTISYSYSTFSALKSLRSPRAINKVIQEYLRFRQNRILKLRPLLKDPIALFSAEWIASRFNADVVVIIRHPAAFVSSLKRKNWQFPFSNLSHQPLLMEKLPEALRTDVIEYTNTPPGIIDQASLIWKICHFQISKYSSEHSEWMFVKHEDLSMNPVEGFSQIFDHLNLEFTNQMELAILEYSSLGNIKEAPNQDAHFIKLNSHENIKNWKCRLSPCEIDYIRHQVEPISKEFYSDEDW